MMKILPKTISGMAVLWASLVVSGVEQTQWGYATNGGAITVTNHYGNNDQVIVPNTMDGLPVTSIGNYAFWASVNTTSVLIPASVTNIAEFAFYGSGLTAITVQASSPYFISSIDGVLFNKQQTLLIQYPRSKTAEYKVPRTVTNIGINAFLCCTDLLTVQIPGSVTNIAHWAFYECTNLRDVTIPDGVVSIGSEAFTFCHFLTRVTFGNTVNNIADKAFSRCMALTNVYFKGNAPDLVGTNVFEDTPVIIYHLPGATGWSNSFCGRPTAIWNPPTNSTTNAKKK